MLIRTMRVEDIPHAAALIGKNYSEEWERRATPELEEMFSASVIKPTYLVAEDEGHIVGLAGFIQSWMDYAIFQIFWVNVAPERQRSGIGYQLVGKVIDTIAENEEAALIQLTTYIPSYYGRNFGFKVVDSLVRETYQLMTLSIEDPDALHEKHLKNFYNGDRSLWTRQPEQVCSSCGGTLWVRTIDLADERSIFDQMGFCEKCNVNGNVDELIGFEVGW